MANDERLNLRSEHNKMTSIKIALLAVSVVGVLAANAGVQHFDERDRATYFQNALEQSINRRAQVRQVFSLLQDLEIAHRDYLLTAEPAFLTEFERIQQVLPTELDALVLMLAAGTQNAQGQQLRALILDRERFLLNAGEQREKFGLDEAVESLSSEPGEGYLENARLLVKQMLDLDTIVIDHLAREIRTETSKSQFIMVALLGGILVLVTGFGVMGIAYLGHRHRMEGTLREAMEKAELASGAKTAFLASMSHEIRTPLTGILGFTELLLQERLAKNPRRFVERIQSAATILSAIVNDILDFSKIEAGGVALEAESFSLLALIDDALSITSGVAHKKGLTINVNVAPTLPKKLIGDQFRLRQILLNLLSNAVKFTKFGHIDIAVLHERSSAAGEMVRIVVSDTGIGFSPEKRDLLFRRFSQLDSTIGREFGGTGLGLAISKQLIELMGGQIGVESEEGIGSKFWIVFTLPRADDDEEQPLELYADRPRNLGRILLVEDSEQNQELVSTILRTAGHQVDIVNDGFEAIEAVQSAQYDLVLMDVQMRRMDGITATRKIRELDHPASRVPIIALTANVLPQQINAFREVGMNDFIGKPFKRKTLVTNVGRWISAATTGRIESDLETSPSATHDGQALDDLRDLMGDEWVLKSLRKLREQIDETFQSVSAEVVDHAQLMQKAHLMVSNSAQLGFFNLSRSCSELEEYCASGKDPSGALRSAKLAARAAAEKADELLGIAVSA